MQGDMHKVNAEHLKRNAYLYIRQSTARQVQENTESTKRQYALQQRAIALGWHPDRIVLSTATWDNPAVRRRTARVSKNSWPKWVWGTPG
jgi:hypothetical protein